MPSLSPTSPSMATLDWLESRLLEGMCDGCCELLRERLQKVVASGLLVRTQVSDDDAVVFSSSSFPVSVISDDRSSSCGSFDTPEFRKDRQGQQSLFGSGKGFSRSEQNMGKTGSGNASSSSISSTRSIKSNAYSSALRKGIALDGVSPSSVNSANSLRHGSATPSPKAGKEILFDDLDDGQSGGGDGLPKEQREWNRFSQVVRKKDFMLMEKVKAGNYRRINVLEGLELHSGMFNASEQEKIVDCVYSCLKLGRQGKLRERTFSEPRKWMPGKGRITLQFGCCYNYSTDRNGNPPGIIRDEEVDPLPPILKSMIKRLVRWHVLPPSCVPNSSIVNIYEKGDCIPPHIDHHDFVRPFCTVSFLAECNILFGQKIEVLGPAEFSAPVSIPLPVGSVLVLNGNGADVASHCVPGVPAKRISITFRKMDDSKLPLTYSPDHDLQRILPLSRSPHKSSSHPVHQSHASPGSAALLHQLARAQSRADVTKGDSCVQLSFNDADFPALG